MSAFDRLHPAVRYHVVNSLGWASLRPTQLDAIDPIQAGEHCLLLAPTAGGKTEAAIIPVLSRMSLENWAGLSVIYVCPIKALLNNLEPRLSRYASLLGRTVEVWHGDISPSRKKRALATQPDIVLTTPESIEGMLISRNVDCSTWFNNLRCVIIDELHAAAADDRGWHLRSVLLRLAAYCSGPIQRIGLSATVHNPEELLAWLAPTGARHIVGASTVSTDADVMIDHVGSLDNAATVISRMHPGEKRLVFCDSRSVAERLGVTLRERNVRTFVSHASLSADERRQAEAAFAEERDCVIVSTSTLELGIDVGDLDRVIQIDAPGSVSSFLQRMGRTGRRSGTRRNCLFLTTKPATLMAALGICRLWTEQRVESVVPPPLPWHVLAQQALLAVIEARGTLIWKDWLGMLAQAFPELPEVAIGHSLMFLVETGQVTGGPDLPLSAGPELERVYGRSHYRDLIATFSGGDLLIAKHGVAEVGYLDPTVLSDREEGPPQVLLAGRAWQVSSLDWSRRIVQLEPATGKGKARWMGSGQSMSADLADAIRRVLMDAGPGAATLSRRATTALDELTNQIPASDQPQVETIEGGRFRLWTFAGTRANRRQLIADRSRGAYRCDGLTIDYRMDPRSSTHQASDEVGQLEDRDFQQMVTSIKFRDVVPEDRLREMVFARNL